MVGKRAFSAGDDAAGVVHRQRGLGDVGELLRVGHVQRRDVGHGLHQVHLGRHLADCALDLGVAGVADQHDLAALGGVAAALVVHLGDQRAGGVDHRQLPVGGQLLDPLGDAMGREDRHRAGRDLVQLIDEHGAAGAQILHHVAVVDDFVTDVDRRAVLLQRPLDDFDRPLDAGAETAGLGEDDADHGQFSNRRRRAESPTRCLGIWHAAPRGTMSGGHMAQNRGLAVCRSRSRVI